MHSGAYPYTVYVNRTRVRMLNERDHDRVDCVDGARGHHENEEEETIRQVEKAWRQKERAHTGDLRCHKVLGTP